MIAQRIKALRRELHMTQTEFGKVIGLSQGHLTSIESGKRNVTERTVATICRVFRVNEAWLREGRGAMFLGERGDILRDLAESYHLDPLEQVAVEAFLTLSPRERQGALAFFNNLVEKINCAYEESRQELLASDRERYAARNGETIDQDHLNKLK